MPLGPSWHSYLDICQLTGLSNAPIERDDGFILVDVCSIDDNVLNSNEEVCGSASTISRKVVSVDH